MFLDPSGLSGAGHLYCSVAADIDKDGTLDTGLTAAWSAPATGRQPKKYRVEIWRRKGDRGTDGNNVIGYTLWKTVSTDNLSDTFKANANYFHKCRVIPITVNGVEGTPSAYTTVGVQPDGISAGPAAPTNLICAGTALGLLYFLDPCPDRDYSFTEILIKTSSTTPTAADGGNASGNAAVGMILTFYPFFSSNYWSWARHVNKSGKASAWVAVNTTAGPIIPSKISNNELASASVDVAQLQANSVTQVAIANDSVGTGELIDGSVTLPKLSSNVFANGISGMSLGGIGTYAMLKNNSGAGIAAGGTTSGSNLAYSSTHEQDGAGTVSGTWRAMGGCPNLAATLWLRVS